MHARGKLRPEGDGGRGAGVLARDAEGDGGRGACPRVRAGAASRGFVAVQIGRHGGSCVRTYAREMGKQALTLRRSYERQACHLKNCNLGTKHSTRLVVCLRSSISKAGRGGGLPAQFHNQFNMGS